MKLGRLMRYASLVLKLPPKVFMAKVTHRLKSDAMAACSRQRDRWRSTYELLPQHLVGAVLAQRCSPVASMLDTQQIDAIRAIASHYLEHRFDLLGSGWVQVRHGMVCAGLEGHRYPPAQAVLADLPGRWLDNRINPSNLKRAQSIWALVTPGYVPIDWHVDFKSGYRWDEKTWYQDVQFGQLPGVDVKVPWELARMQHLPQLAHAYALASNGTVGFAPPGDYAREFRDQVLDFVSGNPPRYGVNWACTMDVGIRVANWLMAHDLFIASGARFDDEFEQVLLQSVYQHGQHIINNLEWHAELRNNHYLGDIVGLLFVAAYLPCSSEIDAWLAFAVQELIVEVKDQFYDDGGNFEASTSYHRLSAELVVYATALTVGLPEDKRARLGTYDHTLVHCTPGLLPAPKESFPIPGSNLHSPFPVWYWARLEKMAEFTFDIARPDGRSPQFGDNDSGRLFKLAPNYIFLTTAAAQQRYRNLSGFCALAEQEMYPMEVHLDHRHLVAAISGLCPRADFRVFTSEFMCETAAIECLAMRVHVQSMTCTRPTPKIGDIAPCISVSEENRQTYVFPAMRGETVPGLTSGLQCRAYPDFGLFVYTSERLYLAIRCGPIGLKGLGAHAHNDPLAIELWIDGRALIIDPGTYLYTPLPQRRNDFRSVRAHFAPYIEGREPGNLGLGIFALGDEARATCLTLGEDFLVGAYQFAHAKVFRRVQIDDAAVTVTDWASDTRLRLHRLDIKAHAWNSMPYSDGYGRLIMPARRDL